jgi:hypothetical protein
MLSRQLEEGFDNPQTQIEYAIFSIAHDVKSLVDRFDTEKDIDAFFTKQSVEELSLATARLDSLVKVISLVKGK